MKVPFNVLLPGFAREKIALVKKDKGFALPEFSQEDIRFNTVAGINDAVLAAWHLPVTVSRCIADGADGQNAVFALHNHDENWKLPPEAQWLELNALGDLTYDSSAARLAVMDWLASERDPSWRTVPWSSPSWLARATRWITQSVEKSGATVIGAPTQVRAWAISCVLKVVTTSGTLYFKAVPDFFGHEPIIASYLLQHFPNYMIEVTDIEPEQHWMLTKEFAGLPPETKEDWHLVLKTMIEIQEHSNANFDELLSLGCKDRRLALLPTLLQPVFEDLKQPKMRELYGVDEAEAEELARRLRSLPKLCEELAACGIGETLLHGDLWGPNVVVRDTFTGKSPLIFDWTDAAITHPFFDIYLALTSEKDPAKKQLQKEAHVDVWSEIMPREDVLTAFDRAQKVAPYYYVLVWRHVTLCAPEQARWELLFLLKRFTRFILAAN